MTTIRFKDGQYNARIEDGSVWLESLTETIIFEGLGEKMREDAEKEYFSSEIKYAGQRFNPFFDEYIDRYLEWYIKENKELAQIIDHNLN